MRFDLTDLRLFVTLAEQGSLTRSAQAMNLALASVSERLAGMEALLGAPLVERTRRGVRLTAAGEALMRHARTILAQVEAMRGDLRRYGAGLKGRVRLLANTGGLGVVPDRLCRFLLAYPDLSVDLVERPSAEIVLAVADGRADLGIVADIADLSALETRALAEDQLVVVAGAGHRLAGRSAVAFREILDEPFVGLADAALEIHLGEQASRLGRQLDYRVQLRSLLDVGRLIEAGVGIAVMPEASARVLARPGLAVVPVAEPWALRRLYLCARSFAGLSPQAALLAQHLG